MAARAYAGRTPRSDATRHAAPPPAADRAARRGKSRIKWDRVGRIALTLVLAAVLYSYLNPAIDLVKTYTATTAAKVEFHEKLTENKRLHRRVQSADDPVVDRPPGTRPGPARRRREAARRPRPEALSRPRRGRRPVIGAGTYVLTAALLAAVVVAVGFSAVRVRRRLLPEWEGAPAHLVEAILAVALLIWLAELLGTVQILYDWSLVAHASAAGRRGLRLDSTPRCSVRG